MNESNTHSPVMLKRHVSGLLFSDDLAAGSQEQLILYRRIGGLKNEETCGNDKENNV
jgi:hypothetical protein